MKPENIANYKVDRTGWDAGPWDNEPDRVDFHHAGFACLMLRSRSGNWCGYVGVPASHPAYGADYNEVPVDVHGGLTYGEKCDGSHICHVPVPGEPDDLFWLGFDCHHCWDIAPGSIAFERKHGLLTMSAALAEGQQYRDMAYVRGHVESLAVQLHELAAKVDAVDPHATSTGKLSTRV